MLFSARSQRALRATGLALMIALAIPAFGQTKRALTNDDIIKLVKSGFTDDVIVAMIDANDTAFDVSISGMTSLKDAGISSPVMAAMLKAEGRKRQTTGPLPAPAQSPGLPPSVMNPSGSGGGAGDYVQQMMSMAMSMGHGGPGMGGGMSGMLDSSQLPPLFLLSGDARQPVKPSIAQVASTQTKGDEMPGAGSAAPGMLMSLGRQALSFGMVGGSMFAGPGAGIAMGMMGGLGSMHNHGPPKVTYVWALPGAQSGSVVGTNNPRFEMSYGNLLGIDPDAYEPQLIRLVGSKDNWRLVGATKTPQGQMGTEAYEKVTEVRIGVKSERRARGQVQIEPKDPLEPGEYAVVLRAIHPGKRAEGSLGGGAETSIFFSVWDFSVSNDERASKPRWLPHS